MYRADDIKSGLMNVVGWRQDQDSADIDSSLLESESGQYFQEFHPLIRLENIRSVSPDFDHISYTAWGEAQTYNLGDRVTFDDTTYEATQTGINQEPSATSEYWRAIDMFSEWLTAKTESSVLKVIRDLWNHKLSTKTANNILDHHRIPNTTARLTDIIENPRRLTGFEITPTRSEGVTTKINKIGLQFDTAGVYPVYLMHSSQPSQIKRVELTITRAGHLQWFNLTDWILPYVNTTEEGTIGAGGSWYLIYDQNEIPSGAKAINNTYDWSQKPCGSCNRGSLSAWGVWSRYIEINPFEVNPTSVEVTGQDYNGDFNNDYASEGEKQMWDVADNVYQPTTNYGISLELTLECDLTDVIIEQRHIFQSAIGNQMAADMLREFAYNPSFNINREQTMLQRKEILYELDGFSDGRPSGIKHDLKEAMKALDVDLHKLSRACMKCGNKGIKFRAT